MPPTPSNQPLYSSREAQARAEIGVTEVRRPVAFLLAAFFLAVLLAGMGIVLFNSALRGGLASAFDGVGAAMKAAAAPLEESGEPRTRLQRLLAPNHILRDRLVKFEEILDEDFPAAVALRNLVQSALASLGAGDEQVLIGQDGWIYYALDVTALTGGGIARNPRRKSVLASPAIETVAEFAEDLAEHGIQLVLLPIPVKPAVHPEGLAAPSRTDTPPWPSEILRVRGYAAWAAAVTARGAIVFDAAPVLKEVRQRDGRAYLQGDTHWTPDAMDAVAAALATRLRESTLLPPTEASVRPVETSALAASHTGDTAMMLALLATHRLRTPEAVEIHPVASARADDAAVVLLGDSFSNIFSLGAMGWGTDAGFAERLAYHLAQPVRPFVRNDGGAWASRERFAQAVARGDARLENLRVVVWQFSERELAHGDWRAIPLPEAPRTRPATPVPAVPEVRTEQRFSARIAAVSDGPRRDAPYADFLIKWHVTDLRSTQDSAVQDPPEAVVMLYGMKQRTLLPTTTLRPGTHVIPTLRPWAEVEATHGTLNAGTLDDPMLELDLPLFWAETVEEQP